MQGGSLGAFWEGVAIRRIQERRIQERRMEPGERQRQLHPGSSCSQICHNLSKRQK
jgi:hypothetical protein